MYTYIYIHIYIYTYIHIYIYIYIYQTLHLNILTSEQLVPSTIWQLVLVIWLFKLYEHVPCTDDLPNFNMLPNFNTVPFIRSFRYKRQVLWEMSSLSRDMFNMFKQNMTQSHITLMSWDMDHGYSGDHMESMVSVGWPEEW